MNDLVAKFAKEWQENEGEMLGCIDEGDWEQDHKYQYNTSIYEYEGRYIRVNQSRSGSYHSDWYYNDPDFDEVAPRKVVVETTVWDRIK